MEEVTFQMGLKIAVHHCGGFSSRPTVINVSDSSFWVLLPSRWWGRKHLRNSPSQALPFTTGLRLKIFHITRSPLSPWRFLYCSAHKTEKSGVVTSYPWSLRAWPSSSLRLLHLCSTQSTSNTFLWSPIILCLPPYYLPHYHFLDSLSPTRRYALLSKYLAQSLAIWNRCYIKCFVFLE